ncbi:hypothetical protein [Thalassolituus oleivorans]|uniref:poly(ethylene terephthalate) hydrolase family protein n=1 Tax=Thalassolituus oleivorans TaxID=187493 RepID=UPI0030C7C449
MKYLTAFRIAPIACAAFLQGCFGGSTPTEPTDPTAQDLTNPGTYEVCSYEDGIASDTYASARITYPCDLNDGPYPATTLTGGFTNTKEQMEWLSEHLTTHGYVVITMTPTNTLGFPPVWATAQHGGFDMLATENSRTGSPIKGEIDLDNRNLMGFSMGGGGVLLAAGEMGTGYKSAIALAPWLGQYSPAYENIQEPMLVLGSENDELAYYSDVFYASLPTNIERGLAIYTGASHFDWYGSSNPDQKAKFRTLVTAFLEVQLKDNQAAESYFNGAEHDSHVAESWFSMFDYQAQ